MLTTLFLVYDDTKRKKPVLWVVARVAPSLHFSVLSRLHVCMRIPPLRGGRRHALADTPYAFGDIERSRIHKRAPVRASMGFSKRLYTSALKVKRIVARAENERLVRTLGKWDLTLLGVGASIGAGIFVLTGIAAKMAGPAVCFSFLIAAVMCILNALAYAELSSRFPESGSAYLYAYLVFGEMCAIVAGVNLLIDYHVGAASIARSLVGYFAQLCKDVGFTLPGVLVAIPVPSAPFISLSILAPLVLFLITLVLIRGVSESSKVSNALTLLKIFIVLLVIFAGITIADHKNMTPFAPHGGQGVISASALVFFAYIGFDAVSNTAEECKNPQRDLPFGIVASLLICAALYMGVTLVLCCVVSYSAIDENAPLTTAFKGHGMHWIELVIDFGACVGLSTTLLVGLYSQARIYLGIARDGLLPKKLALVDGKSGTPVFAQIVCFIIAGSLALLFDVHRLSSVLSIGIMFAYTVVCAAVLVLRVNAPEKVLLSPALFALAFFSVGAGFSSKYNAAMSVTVSFAVLAVLCLFIICFRLTFGLPSEPMAFACPWVPFLPALGVMSNAFMMAQLQWEAWARLVIVTLCVLAAYSWKVWKSHREGSVDIDECSARLLGEDAQSAAESYGTVVNTSVGLN